MCRKEKRKGRKKMAREDGREILRRGKNRDDQKMKTKKSG